MHSLANGESNAVPTASWVVQKVFFWRLQNTLSEWIGVKACLATTVESARMIQAGSNLAQLIYDAHFARNICVCWNRIIIFSFMRYQRWPQLTYVWPAVKLRRIVYLLWNIAQFVSYGLLLNLFFGSLQTDNWMLRYVHFKDWGEVGSKNKVYSWFTFALVNYCVNYV